MTRTNALPCTAITRRPSLRALNAFALSATLALTLTACRSKTADAGGEIAKMTDGSAATASRVSACALMPVEEINGITGESYTTAKAEDDGRSSHSSCHYESPSNPAGASLEVQWITPRDYSNPAEHAALQKAALGGAAMAGKLTGGMGGGAVGGMTNGPVEGVGDAATMSMMLLTARKGDYTITVQIIPTNMMAMLTDSTVAIALAEHEKAIARKVLGKV
ncbi:MAG: hypothetical protein ABI601_09525 [bacterium]